MFEFPEPKLAGVGALTEETEQSYHLIPNFVFAPMHSFGFPLHLYWPNGVGKRRFETVWLGADWGAGERPPEWQSYIEG